MIKSLVTQKNKLTEIFNVESLDDFEYLFCDISTGKNNPICLFSHDVIMFSNRRVVSCKLAKVIYRKDVEEDSKHQLYNFFESKKVPIIDKIEKPSLVNFEQAKAKDEGYINSIWRTTYLDRFKIEANNDDTCDKYLILYKKQKVGFIHLHLENLNPQFDEPLRISIVGLFLERNHQRQGLGSRIIERFKNQEARLEASVYSRNTEAEQFCLSSGFKETSRSDNLIHFRFEPKIRKK